MITFIVFIKSIFKINHTIIFRKIMITIILTVISQKINVMRLPPRFPFSGSGTCGSVAVEHAVHFMV